MRQSDRKLDRRLDKKALPWDCQSRDWSTPVEYGKDQPRETREYATGGYNGRWLALPLQICFTPLSARGPKTRRTLALATYSAYIQWASPGPRCKDTAWPRAGFLKADGESWLILETVSFLPSNTRTDWLSGPQFKRQGISPLSKCIDSLYCNFN